MRLENRTPPVEINLPGSFSFAIDELLPSSAPAKATLRIKLASSIPNGPRAGDRDDLLDERAAVVTERQRRHGRRSTRASIAQHDGLVVLAASGSLPGAPFVLCHRSLPRPAASSQSLEPHRPQARKPVDEDAPAVIDPAYPALSQALADSLLWRAGGRRRADAIARGLALLSRTGAY